MICEDKLDQSGDRILSIHHMIIVSVIILLTAHFQTDLPCENDTNIESIECIFVKADMA